jgi:Uma2 family endonuclease
MAQAAVAIEEEKQEMKPASKRKIILKELIYEMRHGRPIYYRDYDKVLSGEKSLEEVMGSGLLQARLITLIFKVLIERLDFHKYEVYTNELGFKFAPRSWRNLDIAIFDKEKIKEYIAKRYKYYVPVAPQVVIEIDTKADLRRFHTPMDYFHEKILDLLNAGVQKVIWIFTASEMVWVAERNKKWIIQKWDEDIEVIENIVINVQKLLNENE